MTVVVTVHAYVFFSLYVVNGETLMQVAGTDRVLDAVDALGGVYAFGTYLPIWAIVLIEFAFAFTLEMTMGSPCSFRLASKVFSPKTTHPVLFQPLIRTVFKLIFCKKKSLQPNSELSA